MMVSMKNEAMDTMVKEMALRVYNGMIVEYRENEKNALDVSSMIQKFPGCYAVNNSTVSFVYDGNFYVAPFTRKLLSILRSNGFKEEYFYVPFSNGDTPVYENQTWLTLYARARSDWWKEFENDCMEYCAKRNIGTISEESLANCLVIPVDGIGVKHVYFENTVYPVFTSSCLDCRCENLGKYTCNNGRVVFVYCDGTTRVAKGYRIVEELKRAGYTEGCLFVPFSNGEAIQDSYYSNLWDKCQKF